MKNPEPMKPLFIPLMSLLLLCGCARQKTFVPDVDDVLAENPELKRVLDHCKDDSLKYRAARFLIANLPYHATNDAPSMDAQLKLYELHSTGKYSPEEVTVRTALHRKVFAGGSDRLGQPRLRQAGRFQPAADK